MNVRPLVLFMLAVPCCLAAQDPMASADSAWISGDHARAFQIYTRNQPLSSQSVTALHRMALVNAWDSKYTESLALLDDALQIDPSYTAGAVERARVLGLAHRYDDALQSIDRILSQKPNDVDALEARAQLSHWSGRNQDAITAYDRLASMLPDASRLRLPRAYVLSGMARYPEALALIDEVLRGEPRNLEALKAKAEIAALAGRSADAVTAYAQLIAVADDPTPYLLARAELLAAAQRYDEAIADLDRVLARQPQNVGALGAKARYTSWAGRFPEAVNAYRGVIPLTEDPNPLRLQLARVLSWSTRYPESLAELDRILASEPDNIEALQAKAEIATAAGSSAAALQAYDELIRRSRDATLYRLPRVRLLAEQGQLAEAVLELDRLLAEQPDNLEALEYRAQYLAALERYDESVATYERLISAAPNGPAYRLPRARVLAWSGRLSEAVTSVDEILVQEPMNLEALEAKALFTTWAGRYRDSIHVYDQLLALTQGSLQLQHLLPRTRLLVYDRQFEEAVVGYERVLELTPNDNEAIMGLGQVLSWLGRYDESEAVYRRLLTTDPGSLDARRGLAQVSTWRGDLRVGEQQWRDVTESNPTDIGARVGLAANLRMQGRGNAAKAVLDEVARLGPPNQVQLDERFLADRSVAPALTPTYGYFSDSEDNRIHSLGVNGLVHLSDPLQLSVNVGRRDLEERGAPELATEVLSADVALTTRALSGWGLMGGIGVWQPTGSEEDGFPTFTAAILAPPWWTNRADLTFVSTAYDVTAEAAEQGVEIRELRLDGAARFGQRASVFAVASAARLFGTQTNDRLLGGARFAYQILPWLASGPAVRAFSFRKDVDDVYWDPDSYALFELPVAFGPVDGELVPRLEVAPGYQHTAGEPDPWSVSMRVLGGVTYHVSPRRQIMLSAIFSNSGLQQVSSGPDPDYEARGLNLLISWAF